MDNKNRRLVASRPHRLGRKRGSRSLSNPRSAGESSSELPTVSSTIGGEILTWDPPRALSYRWFISGGPTDATDVAITFTAEGESTTVAIQQTGWERLKADGPKKRAANQRGWNAPPTSLPTRLHNAPDGTRPVAPPGIKPSCADVARQLVPREEKGRAPRLPGGRLCLPESRQRAAREAVPRARLAEGANLVRVLISEEVRKQKRGVVVEHQEPWSDFVEAAR